jgi:hypothetical protein
VTALMVNRFISSRSTGCDAKAPYFRLVRYGAIQPGLKGGNRLFFSVFRFFSNLKESGSIEAEAK